MLAFTVFLVGHEISLVTVSITVLVHSIAFSFASHKVAVVDIAVGQDEMTLAMGLVISPVTVVRATIEENL